MALVIPLADQLNWFVFQALHDGEDAHDVVQDAFLKAWHAFPRFRGDCSTRTWMYRILNNLLIDRHHARRPDDHSLEVLRDSGHEPEDRRPGPYDRTAMRHDVERVLDSLDEVVRNAVLLRGLGFNYQEVGDILGFTRQTVSTWVKAVEVRFADALKISIDDAIGLIDAPTSEDASREEPHRG